MNLPEFPAADTVLLEGMTSLSALLDSAEQNDRKILKILFDRSKKAKKAAEFRFLSAKAQELHFVLELTDAEEIDRIATGKTHGGIVAFCTPRTVPPLTADRILPGRLYVYLEGMEDPYNFGSALRSLYAAGAEGIVLPERNWMSAAGVVAKASAGASERFPIFWASPEEAAELFHRAGYRILCAGIRDSVSVYDGQFSYPILLVIGGEKRGISRGLLDHADAVVRIDYGRAFRGSLSAAASSAILAFELSRQNRTKS